MKDKGITMPAFIVFLKETFPHSTVSTGQLYTSAEYLVQHYHRVFSMLESHSLCGCKSA